jgi:hypothetical protein
MKSYNFFKGFEGLLLTINLWTQRTPANEQALKLQKDEDVHFVGVQLEDLKIVSKIPC